MRRHRGALGIHSHCRIDFRWGRQNPKLGLRNPRPFRLVVLGKIAANEIDTCDEQSDHRRAPRGSPVVKMIATSQELPSDTID